MDIDRLAAVSRAHLDNYGLTRSTSSVELLNEGTRRVLTVAVWRPGGGTALWSLTVKTGFDGDGSQAGWRFAPEVQFFGLLTPIAVDLIRAIDGGLPAQRSSETFLPFSRPE